MLKIPEGHRVGPYVVVGIDDEKLKCLYSSGVYPKNVTSSHRILALEKIAYSFYKSTYVRITENSLITRDRFLRKLTSLDNEDKKYLYKKIGIVADEGIYTDIKIDTPRIPLEIGDIILDEIDLYLIVTETDSHFLCSRLSQDDNETKNFIRLGDKKYSLNFDSLKKYSKLSGVKRYDFIDDKNLKRVLGLYQQRLNFLKRKKEISRGSLIRMNGIFYYVYGEIGSEWMAVAVIGQPNNDLCHLVIGGKHFYTDFNDNIQISKKILGIEIIATASEKEMNTIKEDKKSYIKGNLAKMKAASGGYKDKYPEIQVGTIVGVFDGKSDPLNIVISRCQDRIVTIKYNDYLNGNYILNAFFVDQLEVVGNMDYFNLKQILVDIQEIAEGYISKKRIKKLIKELEN